MLGSSRCSLHHVHNKKLGRQEIDSEESSRKVPSDKREGLRAHTYPGDKHANLSRLFAVDSSRRNLHIASASTSPLAARCIALLADAYIPGAWAQEAKGDTPLHIAIRARNLQSVRKKSSLEEGDVFTTTIVKSISYVWFFASAYNVVDKFSAGKTWVKL